ncbi:MAG: radical SAM protein [Deltaproteobacteria bacterium]|nr:MAG: radical SAM protein [Deltaproteobacteria bacterium]
MVIAYPYRPESLYLNVTNRCSNDCRFCVRNRGDFSLAGFDMRLTEEPSADQVLAAIAEREAAHGGPFGEVVFCGFGEPTFRLELIGEVGRTLRSAGTTVRLNTNGQGALIAGRDPWPTLTDALDAVSISLNAPDSVSYQALCRPRHGEAAYDAVLSFAQRASERLDEVVLTVVGFTLDDDATERCEQIANSLGVGFRIR